jgi:Tol biopolymer transport system component
MKLHLKLLASFACLFAISSFFSSSLGSRESQAESTWSFLPLIFRSFPLQLHQLAFLDYGPSNILRDLVTVYDDGSQYQNLTNQPSHILYDWSPDGSRFTLSARWSGNDEIYTMKSDGSDLAQLTYDPGYDTAPSWSSDGTRIAFDSNRDGSYEIYSMDSDGNNLLRLTDLPANCFSPKWSPNGNRIAFMTKISSENDREVYIMNDDGSGLVRLSDNGYYDYLAGWSPDGSQILILSNRDHQGELGNNDVYTINADGSGIARLTYDGYVGSATWSPDGIKIAYSDFDPIQPSGLMLMNPDGSHKTSVLCQSEPIMSQDPAWSNDSQRIAFSTPNGNPRGVYVTTIDGTSCLNLAATLAYNPQWNPGE